MTNRNLPQISTGEAAKLALAAIFLTAIAVGLIVFVA